MRILILTAGVAGMALTAPAFADWTEQGRGKGQENRGGGGDDRGRGNGGGDDRGRGNGGGGDDRGRGRGGGEDRGRGGGNDDRGRGGDFDRAREMGQRQQERARDQEQRVRERVRDVAERRGDRDQRSVERAERREERGFERGERRAERAERRLQRRAARVESVDDLARLRWEPSRGLVNGCPPGLAKKNNGCQPPGQVRQVAESQSWYNGWWARPDSTDYVYDDGYLVRVGNQGVESFLPLLGGALWPGQAWPDQFQAAPVDDYHVDYFGLQQDYDYRFANGAIYGVDPTNDLIQQVAALVAGDEWAVGQQMPDGYGIYNVPYEHRDQYQDTDDAMYRYSDGYVYQVDPTTQLIQAAIQLIT